MPPPNAAAGGGLVLPEPGAPKLLHGMLPEAAGGGLVLAGPGGSKMPNIFLLVEADWRLCGGNRGAELYPARSWAGGDSVVTAQGEEPKTLFGCNEQLC